VTRPFSPGHFSIGRLLAALVLSLSVILPQTVVPASAATERAIYLYYTHTKETARIVFKRNGQYVQQGLNDLNYFLRDWRRNEPTKMDPQLFDLIWEVYQEVGATQPINVVSAYRSPATNEMLRETSSGVAENSQHTKGHAMDFFIPGIPLAKLRAVAMRKQVGGVGYYPTSGSPFVHLDTGSVRAWPRMTRAQLKEIFPDGKTMHLPTDGTPLSQQGYQVAMAEWKQCHRYPCGGTSSGSNAGGGKTLMAMLFGGEEATPATSAPATPTPTPTVAQPVPAIAAASASALAPVPFSRPQALGTSPTEVAVADTAPGAIPFATEGSAPLEVAELETASGAPMPLLKSAALQAATASALPAGDAVTALAALTAPVPQPRLIMTDPPDSAVVTAYAPALAQDPEAQKALEMIIARETTATVSSNVPPTPAARLPILPPPPGTPALRTASLGGTPGGTIDGLFENTFSATVQNAPVAAALQAHVEATATPMRKPALIAPDLEHVADVLTTPVELTSSHFAVIWDHDEADFDPTTEMGRFVPVLAVGDFPEGLSSTGFVAAPPLSEN
jgi:uncharacterized protein YcbK (DUF882 family)